MLKKLTSLITVIAMLVLSIVPAVFAEAPTGYDYVIYSNDFQSAEVGENLAQSEINYRPENCNYAVVQEGDNKYYTFSPSSTSSRANSGNLQDGYFLPETVASKPIRKLKLELDVAVDLKSDGPAGVGTYFRGTDAGGHLNSRWNIVEFNSTEYYSLVENTTRMSYTPGEWIHFTIYADYENNLCSIYSDGGFAVENIRLTAEDGVDKFTQIRMSFNKGDSTDSSMKLDNIVYSTTQDVFEAIGGVVGGGDEEGGEEEGGEAETPSTGDPKPADYGKELYFEDFDGDSKVDTTSLEWKPGATVTVDSGDDDVTSTKDQGDYVNVTLDNKEIDNYFRMFYGSATAPIQRTGISRDDLTKTQVSFDVCHKGNKTINIRFFDKWTTGSTKSENFIVLGKDGYMTFANTDTKVPYNFNEWMSFDVFADFDARVYTVYLNGSMVATAPIAILPGCIESVGMYMASASKAHSYTVYMDNIRIAIPQSVEATVTDKVNNASDSGEIEAVFAEYADVLALDSSVYCQNTYDVVLEQAPYSDIEEIKLIANKASELLNELNSIQNGAYTSYFSKDDYKNIVLKGAEKLNAYTGYAKSKKAKINAILAKSSPFDSFRTLRTAFDGAVTAYQLETGDDGSVKDYNVVLYSNDFEASPAGAGLTNEAMDYIPENCDYAVVEEGDNKYYTFSPNNLTLRANSGNTENGHLASTSVAASPIRQLKVDIDMAVDLKGGKTAGLSTYYRGKNLVGTNGIRRNIVTFTDSEYYAESDNTIRADYTPGEWIHFTLYLDYLNNLATIYADDILFAEGVAIFEDSNNDRFTQIRLVMDPGTTLDSSIRVDNIVYSTTEDEYDSFRYTNLYPDLTDPKPYDYNRVLFEEDFEGDAVYSKTDFDAKSNKNIVIASGDPNTESARDQGSYVNVAAVDIDIDNYFRMQYGLDTAPVQASGVALEELSRMQFSFDLCPASEKDINVRFLDKWSNPDSTKGETLIMGSGGTLTFANCDKKMPYVLNEWMSFDVFFDFNAKTYTVYLNGNAVVKDVPLKVLTTCAENVGLTFGTPKTPESYSIYMDNFRVAIPDKLEVVSSIPENGSTGFNVFDDVVIEFSNPIDNFKESLVSVKAEGAKADYKVSAKNNVITISFPEGMDFGTEYTVTLSKDICDMYGNTLGEDLAGSCITMSEQVTSSVPVISNKVSANVINPGSEAISAALVVTAAGYDGSLALYSQQVNVLPGEVASITVDYDPASEVENKVVMAFVADSLDSLRPLRDVYTIGQVSHTSAGSSSVTASVDSLQVTEGMVTVYGSISAKESQIVVLKVADKDGNTVYALPVSTDENGEFVCSYSLADSAYGKYTVSITGANVTASSEKVYVKLSEAQMLEIKNNINKASGASGVKAVLDSYKDYMRLDEGLYNKNTYDVLAEQKPFGSYDEIVNMIYTADELLGELGSADWSSYSKLFEENEDILFNSCDEYDEYSGYSANKKNAVNKIVMEYSPFAGFGELREALGKAMEEYNEASSSSGSSGGGGGKGSSVASSYNVGTIDSAQNTDTPVLFADMAQADWAKAHVNVLYSKGIVSPAASYRPLDNVTREEFVKMLVQLAGLTAEGTPDFTDVQGDEWFAPYLAAAQKAGIIKGSDNGSFGVGSNITRQDMVVMAQRTAGVMNKTVKQTKEPVDFADSASISDYAVSAVSEMQRAGVISGMGNGFFEPLGLANRAQAAVVICNLMNAME